MTTPLVVNGVTFNYPVTGDTLWGKAATDWATAMTNGTLQKGGGLFPLSSDIDFGPTGGVKAIFFADRSGLVSTTGLLRLANNSPIGWRNAANTGNITLTASASDNLVYTTPVGTTLTLTPTGALTLNSGFSLTAAGNLSIPGSMTSTNFIGPGTGLTGIPNSATTATTANTPNTIVLRDGSGAATVIASEAVKLSNPRTFAITGDGTGTSSAFDGTANATTALTLATVNGSPGADLFKRITVNGKGLVTATSAVTPSDITTALGYVPLGPGSGPSTADLNMGGFKVVNMGTPTANTDAATKLYVDNQVVGANSGLAVVYDTTGTASVLNGQLMSCSYVGGKTTVTLPGSPTAGMIVGIGNYTGRTDLVVARNASKIMALDQDMTIDKTMASVTLKYIDSTQGWVIL